MSAERSDRAGSVSDPRNPGPANGALVLASGSPRRAKILRAAGVRFRVVRTDAEETAILPGRAYGRDATCGIVVRNACLKARAGFGIAGDGAGGVLAADTVVWFHDRILGKPEDLAEAAEFLRMLSGEIHSVFTGVAYLPPDAKAGDAPRVAVVESEVKFRRLSEKTIGEYVARVNPLDRAGAYDIDEAGELLVESCSGEYENVMGLPLAPLREWGVL